MSCDNNIFEDIVSNIDDLHIGKARKKDRYYVCPVTNHQLKTSFYISLKDALMINVKENSKTLHVKCQKMSKYFDTLNEKIINIVRKNSNSWFNTSIDDDLIEEYYISTLQYDKKKGETLRLKIKNIEDIEMSTLTEGTMVNVVLTLKYIKFYKQKFFPEFELLSIEHTSKNNNISFIEDEIDSYITEDEEEVPNPLYDEIQNIKLECLQKLNSNYEQLETNILTMSQKSATLKNAITKLEECSNFQDIIKLCEQYQNIICE
jgi:hypothetical protein